MNVSPVAVAGEIDPLMTSTKPASVLVIDDLAKTYPGESRRGARVHGLRGVSFRVSV